MAGAVAVHEAVRETQAKILVLILLNLEKILLAVRLADEKFNLFLLAEEIIVKDIFRNLSVDGDHDISRLNFQLLTDGAWEDFTDQMFCCFQCHPP